MAELLAGDRHTVMRGTEPELVWGRQTIDHRCEATDVPGATYPYVWCVVTASRRPRGTAGRAGKSGWGGPTELQELGGNMTQKIQKLNLTSGQGHDLTQIGHVAYHLIRIDERNAMVLKPVSCFYQKL